MAERSGFEHIRVNGGDDDVVIVAGAKGAPAPEACAPEAAAAEPKAQAIPAPDPAARPAKPRDGYRETTLADIEGSKMPAAQKAVIALAVLAVAAFIAWYIIAGQPA